MVVIRKKQQQQKRKLCGLRNIVILLVIFQIGYVYLIKEKQNENNNVSSQVSNSDNVGSNNVRQGRRNELSNALNDFKKGSGNVGGKVPEVAKPESKHQDNEEDNSNNSTPRLGKRDNAEENSPPDNEHHGGGGQSKSHPKDIPDNNDHDSTHHDGGEQEEKNNNNGENHPNEHDNEHEEHSDEDAHHKEEEEADRHIGRGNHKSDHDENNHSGENSNHDQNEHHSDDHNGEEHHEENNENHDNEDHDNENHDNENHDENNENHHNEDAADHHDDSNNTVDDNNEEEEKNIKNWNDITLSVEEKEAILAKRTGAQKVAYVIDMKHEQNNGKFRDQYIGKEFTAPDHKSEIAAFVSEPEDSIKSCEYLTSTSDNTRPKIKHDHKCYDPKSKLSFIAYNGANFSRTYCGEPISSKMVGPIHDPCKEAVHILDVDSPIVPPPPSEKEESSSKIQQPIIIHQHDHDDQIDKTQLETISQCQVPCMKQKNMIGNLRKIKGTNWKIIQTMNPSEVDGGSADPMDHKKDIYYSTLSLKSDIPLSYYDFNKYNLHNRPAIPYEKVKDSKAASYLVSDDNCNSKHTRRQRWHEALDKSNDITVHSYGSCHHNTELGDKETIDTIDGRIDIMKNHAFNLGFESSSDKDYVTSITWESLLGGGIPVIVGAKNIVNHIPGGSKSAIIVDQSIYKSWGDLPTYMNKVISNQTLYDSYHAWRTNDTLIEEFENKYKFTQINADCRMCSWAYAKMYGLGWCHQQQIVKETKISRKLCGGDEDGGDRLLVKSPFRESWIIKSSSSDNNDQQEIVIESSSEATKGDDDKKKCHPYSTLDKTIKSADESDDIQIHRIVHEHDSIIDIDIHDITIGGNTITTIADAENHVITLRLQFDELHNTDGAYFSNTHSLVDTERGAIMSSITIQDQYSKVTVVVNWETLNISSPKQGIIEIQIPGIEDQADVKEQFATRKLRIITEDTNTVHDKRTEYYPSSFNKLMLKDFIDPLQVYYVATNNEEK